MAYEEDKHVYYLHLISFGNGRGYARFYVGSEYDRGILEAKVKCDADLLETFAISQGFIKRGKGRVRKIFYTDNWEAYAKTLLYAVVISSIRRRIKKINARERIRELDYFDLKYWVGVIISRYRKMGFKGVLRPAKALKILTYVDKK